MSAPRGTIRPRWILRHRGLLIFAIAAILLVLAARIALPGIIKRAANARLGELPGHRAQVDDVGLSLFRGAYQLEGLTVGLRGTDPAKPLLAIRRIDLSLAWRELVRGRFLAEIVLEEPVLTLQPGVIEREEGVEAGEIFPFKISRLEIKRGTISYRDLGKDPVIDLALTNVTATIVGLAFGGTSRDDTLPARGTLHAMAPGGGQLHIAGTGNPGADPPRFEVAAELSESDLTAYSDLVQSQLGVDVSAGTLHIAFEMNASDGFYEGYLKPLITGSKFEEPDEGALKELWAKIVNFATDALENQETSQMGTRVPFSGNFDKTDVEAWPSFITLLQNAFGQALREGVDGDTAPSAR